MKKPSFLVAGHDARHRYIARGLAEEFVVYTCGTQAVDKCIPIASPSQLDEKIDVLCLPMMKTDGLYIQGCDSIISFDELIPCLDRNALCTGGRLSTKQIEYFSALGYHVTDYFNRQELVVKNCIPTAEGALQLAMENTLTTIFHSNVLITGYGRVARETARLFSACGGFVTIAARNPVALAAAQNSLHLTADISHLGDITDRFDIIINTVPSMLFDKAVLENISDTALIIDLASKPGGVDFLSAEVLGKKTLWALALPEKVAPATSGFIIADTIKNIVKERGMYDAI